MARGRIVSTFPWGCFVRPEGAPRGYRKSGDVMIHFKDFTDGTGEARVRAFDVVEFTLRQTDRGPKGFAARLVRSDDLSDLEKRDARPEPKTDVRGRVVRKVLSRGFGFVRDEDGAVEHWFNFEACVEPGLFEQLRADPAGGEVVVYDVSPDAQHPEGRAVDVRRA